VEAVQRQAGIAVDGTVGPATLAALDRQYRQRVVDPDRAADRYFPATTTTTGGAPTTTSTTPAVTTTTHPAAGTTTTAAGTTSTAAPPSSPGGAPTPAQIAEVQQQLAALGYLPGPVTGRPDVQTSSAVLAFQKRDGLSRDGVIGPQVLARLNGPPGAGPRSAAPGPRVEVDLDRQILFFVDAQGHVTTINVSTGSGTTYQEPGGGTAVAYTPTGNFRVLRKIDANEKAPLGSLYRPMYFKGGWAIHGSPSVPAYPASHGCVRVANWNQDFLFPRLPVGAPVWIYGTSLGSPKGAAPGF
ncbi:MAG TPA: L,D-transpeptidase family protein, partial [Acidimicrobiales bacterium]|nr:L,D-transpeptidase family protein [Acidimicrobiales bacterium]